MWKSLRIGVVGAGRVGGNFAYWLSRKGWHIKSIYSRSRSRALRLAKLIPTGAANDLGSLFRSCDVAFLAVPDEALLPILEQVQEMRHVRVRTLAHFSGMMPSSVLGLAGLDFAKVSLHPMASIPPLDTKQNPFEGVVFGIEGDDFGVMLAKRIALDLGAFWAKVEPSKKPLYHSAAVFGANFVYLLVVLAERLLRDAGIPLECARKMSADLAKSAVRNYEVLHFPDGATGPVARGDASTIAAHIDALSQTPYLDIYCTLSEVLASLLGKEDLWDEVRLSVGETSLAGVGKK